MESQVSFILVLKEKKIMLWIVYVLTKDIGRIQ